MAYETCLSTIGVTWCSVAYVLAVISLLEFLATVIANQFYQIMKHIQMFRIYTTNTLFILYVQLLQTLCMIVHYLVIESKFNIMYMIMIYLQFIENTMVFYYFTSEAAKMKAGKMYKIMGFSLLTSNVGYLTGFAIYFIVGSVDDQDIYNCTNGI